ncbi:MAG: hypothetical protein DCF21_03295 [Leptolyngbya sp.]|jgi:hypothetical protein|uniref:Uncharacterized protein n=1 Tax=Shackletoniella antarctica TaxID=268115 RepID=A0A2W4YNY3_9CYAN|nr:MAG: hypothetical protein DCF17_03825 [Shackletoniella antarctica]PZV21071.1 MAG: hypothetical protein DCF21_03295 [Leptolyngbya sp.]
MASSSPLTGVILVDCARANASGGVAIAAERCGYGTDTAQFQSALKSACSEMNVTIDGLSDLDDEPSAPWHPAPGIEVAPDTPSEL